MLKRVNTLWKESPEKLILLLILFIGTFLRLFHLSGKSLSKEELDLLLGAGTFSFHEWAQGSAGTSLFLFFWTKIFGNSVWIVRLPFAISGIISISILFRIAKQWFGITTAMLAASLLSVSAYFILISQIVSPYSFLLLASLLSIHFWSNIVFSEERPAKKYDVLAMMLFSASMISLHVYGLIFFISLFLIGLLFLKKDRRLSYAIAFVGAVILSIPSLSNAFSELKNGAWMPDSATNSGFNFPEFLFNNSEFLLIPAIGLLATSFIFNYKNWRFTRYHFVCCAFIFIPCCLAFIYSAINHTEFKFPLLLFSAPFVFIFLFSYFKQDLNSKIYLSLLLISLSGINGLIGKNSYYKSNYFSVFKELSEKTIQWQDKFRISSKAAVFNVDEKKYLDYYLNKMNHSESFAQYSCNSNEELGNLKTILDSSGSEYFIYGSSAAENLAETEVLIRSVFPFMLEESVYTASFVRLYSKDSIGQKPRKKAVFNETNDFEKTGLWENDSIMRSGTQFFRGKFAAHLEEKNEYGPTFTRRLNEIKPKSDSCTLVASAWVYLEDSTSGMEFVCSFESLKSVYQWHSQKIDFFVKKPHQWTKIYVARRIPKLPSAEDIVKVYLWNPKKSKAYMDDIQVELFED